MPTHPPRSGDVMTHTNPSTAITADDVTSSVPAKRSASSIGRRRLANHTGPRALDKRTLNAETPTPFPSARPRALEPLPTSAAVVAAVAVDVVANSGIGSSVSTNSASVRGFAAAIAAAACRLVLDNARRFRSNNAKSAATPPHPATPPPTHPSPNTHVRSSPAPPRRAQPSPSTANSAASRPIRGRVAIQRSITKQINHPASSKVGLNMRIYTTNRPRRDDEDDDERRRRQWRRSISRKRRRRIRLVVKRHGNPDPPRPISPPHHPTPHFANPTNLANPRTPHGRTDTRRRLPHNQHRQAAARDCNLNQLRPLRESTPTAGSSPGLP